MARLFFAIVFALLALSTAAPIPDQVSINLPSDI